MNAKLTIIVGGYIVGYPVGGMTWHHLNYLLGLHELGHEVWFLEDSGDYSYCYDPLTHSSGVASDYGRRYLSETLRRYGLPERWCYVSRHEATCYGLTGTELDDLLRRADLLLCVSGVTPIDNQRPRPRRVVGIDTDPGYTQLRMEREDVFRAYWMQFDAVATFGSRIGSPGCDVPEAGRKWIGTRQPVALRYWPVAAPPTPGAAFSTIGKWEHTSDRHFELNGRRLLSSKAPQWRQVMELPGRVDVPLELGMTSLDSSATDALLAAGWRLCDAESVSRSPQSFAEYVQRCAGEFTVAKHLYVHAPTGWFSDRSSAFLASGRPVVTEDTGFPAWLPTGEGLLAYRTVEEAAAALRAVAADYPRHAQAARRLAEAHLVSGKVLRKLLAAVV